jgi:hypothetical protein
MGFKISGLIALLFLTAFFAYGQRPARKLPPPPPTPSPSVVPMAMPTPATGILAIEAGIINKSGGVQPVARTEFRLLDADLASLISAAGMRPDPNMKEHLADAKADLIMTWGLDTKYPSEKPLVLQIAEAIKQHTIQAGLTDFNGKVEFADIKPGQYFIFVRTQTREGFAIWDLPIEIKAGRNSILLDQNNAAVSAGSVAQ